MRAIGKFGLMVAIAGLTVIGLTTAQSALAAPCEGDTVTGTVVAVDEEDGEITLDTGDGECTVTLDGEFDHPIVDLLGTYFSEANLDDLGDSLDAVQVCAHQDEETQEWALADCDAEGTVEVTVTAMNEDGTFQATTEDDEEITLSVEDEDDAEDLSGALDSLMVDWELDGEGGLVEAGEQIQAYHEDGMGFGVLVKLYSMAAASQEECEGEAEAEAETEDDGDGTCGVTVEELVEQFQSGTGLGQLYKEHGKPELRGVGHVRQSIKDLLKGEEDEDTEGEDAAGDEDSEAEESEGDLELDQATGVGKRPSKAVKGDCNARSRGGGNGRGRGHTETTCP